MKRGVGGPSILWSGCLWGEERKREAWRAPTVSESIWKPGYKPGERGSSGTCRNRDPRDRGFEERLLARAWSGVRPGPRMSTSEALGGGRSQRRRSGDQLWGPALGTGCSSVPVSAAPGLLPAQTVKVSVALVTLVLGLIIFVFGLHSWRRATSSGE